MTRRLDTIEYTCWREGDLYCISTRYFGGELFGAESTDSYHAAIQEFIGKCEAVIDEKYFPANWSNQKKNISKPGIIKLCQIRIWIERVICVMLSCG